MQRMSSLASAQLLKVKNWTVKNERWLSPSALIGGFVVDALTIRNLGLVEQTILLLVYLGIIATAIVAAHLVEEKMWDGRVATRLKPLFSLVALFTFGSLFSAFLIFYSRDASLVASWPFLLFLALAFFGTEAFKRYQERLTFQVSLLYFGLFSFSIYLVPVLVKEMGPGTFFVSSLLSLGVLVLFLRFLSRLGPIRFEKSYREITISTAIIFCVMQVLYFTNAIPPIPLALKDIGVYHHVTREGSSYVLVGESKTDTRFFFERPVVHVRSQENVSVFSSVFAPTALKTQIVHVWERFDSDKGEWFVESTVPFSITGGRDGGYRGYSVKATPKPGEWRVSVKTPQGQLIGRIHFTIERTEVAPALSTITAT